MPVDPPRASPHAQPAPPTVRVPGSYEAVLVFLGFVAGQVGAALLGDGAIGAYAGHRFPRDAAAAERLAAAATPYLVVLSILVGAAVGLLLSYDLIRVRGRASYRAAVGWAAGAPSQRLAGAGTGLALAAAYLAVAGWLVPLSDPVVLGPLAEMARTPGLPRVLWTVLALGIGPPVEEFIFRGVLFSGLARDWSAGGAACLTTLLFVILHLPETAAYWPSAGAVTLLGAGTVYWRIRTGAVGPALAMHLAYNGVMVLIAFLPSP